MNLDVGYAYVMVENVDPKYLSKQLKRKLRYRGINDIVEVRGTGNLIILEHKEKPMFKEEDGRILIKRIPTIKRKNI